jgi:hypothetical protein
VSSAHVISAARDFSRTPGPRHARQGNWSGEAFREMLERGLRRHQRLLIVLDGTRGYGSSFLDEAFGGLVRGGVLSAEDASRRLEIARPKTRPCLCDLCRSGWSRPRGGRLAGSGIASDRGPWRARA